MLTGHMGGVSGTRFASPSGTHPADASEPPVTHLSPNATIIARDLRVRATVSAGVPGSVGGFAFVTFTLRDDGVDTAVTCTMTLNAPSTGSTTAERTCNSGQATATIAAGSDLSIKAVATAEGGVSSASASAARFAWRATTP
jgi:hypothetical protein